MLEYLNTSQFLPATLDQIDKAIVRPYLDCGLIYHKPSHLNQSPSGASLNSQMQFLVLGAFLAVQNSEELDGKHT